MARRYTDADRAAALAVLEANDGNVTRTARDTGIPRVTLLGWTRDVDRQGRTADLVHAARMDLADIIRRELEAIFHAMATKRPDASYRELATAAGILTDKLIRMSTAVTVGDKLGGAGVRRVVIEYDDGDGGGEGESTIVDSGHD